MSGRLDDADILSSFLRAVTRAPDGIAIIDNERPMTYAQLEQQMRRVAATLGPRPGTVGVLTARSAGTIAALLGVLAAGGAYCPIDPGFPAQRIAGLTAAAECQAVIDCRPGTTDQAHGRSKSGGVPIAGKPADPAYVLFTSGSTGRPKPVVTPRRAIAAAVTSLAGVMDVSSGDRVLQFASLNWDTCFEEILTALTCGAALVFDDDAYSGSFPRFLKMIDRYRISVLDLPTAFWHEFVTFLTEDAVPVPDCRRALPSRSAGRCRTWPSGSGPTPNC